MAGCRPLAQDEIEAMLREFSGRYSNRNRALVVLGCNSGFRISELLSLTVGDVFARGHIKGRVKVQRVNMKGKRTARDVPLNSVARAALTVWLRDLFNWGEVGGDISLFQSQAKGNRAITRRQASRLLSKAAQDLGLEGMVGTHSLRKTFAGGIYQREKRLYASDYARELPIRVVMKALGHQSVGVTEKYLGLDEAQVDEAVNELNIGGGLFGYAEAV